MNGLNYSFLLITLMAPYILVSMSFVEPQGDGRSPKQKKIGHSESVISRDVFSFDIESLDDLWTKTSAGESFTYPFFLSDGTIIDNAVINISEGCFGAEFTINDPFTKNFTLSTEEKRKATTSFMAKAQSHIHIDWKKREINHMDEETVITGTSKWPGGIENAESHSFVYQSTLKCNSFADLKKELLTCLNDLKFYVDTVARSDTAVPKTTVSVPTLKELCDFNDLTEAHLTTEPASYETDEHKTIYFSSPRLNLECVVGFPDAVRKLQDLANDILGGVQREEREKLGIQKRNILIFNGLEFESTNLVEAFAGTLGATQVCIQKYVTFTNSGFQSYIENFITSLNIEDGSLYVVEFPETRDVAPGSEPPPNWKFSTGIHPDLLFKVLDSYDAWSNVIIVFTVSENPDLDPEMKHHASMILPITQGKEWFEDTMINEFNRIHERSRNEVKFVIQDAKALTKSLWEDGCHSYADMCATIEHAVRMKASQSGELTINQSLILLAWEIISQQRK